MAGTKESPIIIRDDVRTSVTLFFESDSDDLPWSGLLPPRNDALDDELPCVTLRHHELPWSGLLPPRNPDALLPAPLKPLRRSARIAEAKNK